MKPEEIERKLLLKMTNELSANHTKCLETELDHNSTAARIEAELEAIFSAARSTENETRMSDTTMLAIKNHAHRELRRNEHSRRGNRQQSLLKVWQPALLYATAALLILTLSIPMRHLFLTKDSILGVPRIAVLEWDEDLDSQLLALDEEVTFALLEYSEAADADRGIDALVDEFLKIEELEI